MSTNAIHLYPDLADTVASWLRALRPGGHVLVNSGNIRNPRARRSEWILDETVWVVGDLAEGLVRTDPRYAAYRADLDDRERMAAHAAYRDRVFLLPRPLDFYLETLELGRPQGRVGARGQHRGPGAGLVRAAQRLPRRRARVGRRHREGRRRRTVAGGRRPTVWRSCATPWTCSSTAGRPSRRAGPTSRASTVGSTRYVPSYGRQSPRHEPIARRAPWSTR